MSSSIAFSAVVAGPWSVANCSPLSGSSGRVPRSASFRGLARIGLGHESPPDGRLIPPPAQPARGKTTAELAAATGRSPRTVLEHLRRLEHAELAFRADGLWYRNRFNADAVTEEFGIADTAARKRSENTGSGGCSTSSCADLGMAWSLRLCAACSAGACPSTIAARASFYGPARRLLWKRTCQRETKGTLRWRTAALSRQDAGQRGSGS